MLSPDTEQSVYELVANGHAQELKDIINKTRGNLGNKYITPMDADGNFQEVKEGSLSEADLIANKAIEMIGSIEGILNNYDLIQSDEQIVQKAIRDQVIIENLNKAKPKDFTTVGLEGLVLKDYKDTRDKIVKIQSLITNLPESEENVEVKKRLQKELKQQVDKINDIQEGKYGIKYFRLAEAYLNKDIFAPLLNISKNQFAKEKYNEEY